jgi:hypothetical protein
VVKIWWQANERSLYEKGNSLTLIHSTSIRDRHEPIKKHPSANLRDEPNLSFFFARASSQQKVCSSCSHHRILSFLKCSNGPCSSAKRPRDSYSRTFIAGDYGIHLAKCMSRCRSLSRLYFPGGQLCILYGDRRTEAAERGVSFWLLKGPFFLVRGSTFDGGLHFQNFDRQL